LGVSVTYADKTLTCRDCGQAFVFTTGEQEFHASRGFSNEPGRCPDCRAARKAERGGSGGYSSGGYGSDGGYGRQERQMYSATCSSCGREARVPFQPRGDKPVYCSDCFTPRQTRGSGGGGYR
jgi:CxxC-x17-CxxC domain-containing protein